MYSISGVFGSSCVGSESLSIDSAGQHLAQVRLLPCIILYDIHIVYWQSTWEPLLKVLQCGQIVFQNLEFKAITKMSIDLLLPFCHLVALSIQILSSVHRSIEVQHSQSRRPLSPLSRTFNAFWKPWARLDIQWAAGLLYLEPTLRGADNDNEYKV